jgi:hypothetical protein
MLKTSAINSNKKARRESGAGGSHKSKVAQLDLPKRRSKEDVGRLEVAMDHPLRVDVGESCHTSWRREGRRIVLSHIMETRGEGVCPVTNHGDERGGGLRRWRRMNPPG